jgi:NAD(P)-dependent dehydrogenase (short-subunit alcohol dehydrogenase family)
MPAATSESAVAFQENQPEAWRRSQESIPLRRLGDPVTEIGRIVAVLCSDDASFVTGTVVAIDGGQAYLR